MRISGNKPSSVILCQTKWFQKLKMMPRECLNKLKQKGWCNKPTKLQFQAILIRKIFMLLNATNQPKLTGELGYMSSWGLTGQSVIKKKENMLYDMPFYLMLKWWRTYEHQWMDYTLTQEPDLWKRRTNIRHCFIVYFQTWNRFECKRISHCF